MFFSSSVTESGEGDCRSHKAYLSVVCAHRARASERTIRIALVFIWVAKVSHFIIPRLHMKCGGPISVRRKKITRNKKSWGKYKTNLDRQILTEDSFCVSYKFYIYE